MTKVILQNQFGVTSLQLLVQKFNVPSIVVCDVSGLVLVAVKRNAVVCILL